MKPNEINGLIGDTAEETADNVADALSSIQHLLTIGPNENSRGPEDQLVLDAPEVTGLYYILQVMGDALRFHRKQGGAQ